MTLINKNFAAKAGDFLIEQVNELIKNKSELIEGRIPDGPKFKITGSTNPHTKISKIAILICVGEKTHTVFYKDFSAKDTKLQLSATEKAKIYHYTLFGLYNAVNEETEFPQLLETMLSGSTHVAEVKHFTGIEVKFHSDDDSQRFMIQNGNDVYYALEEAVFIQDGFRISTLTDSVVMIQRVNAIITDYIESFEVIELEHTFA